MKFKRLICIFLSINFLFCLFILFSYRVLFPRNYDEIIEKSGYEDKNFIYAVIKAESNFDECAVSQKGASGLMQIMPSTEEFVLSFSSIKKDSIFNPEYNILIGINYIKYLESKFSDRTTLLCAYNAGEGNVNNWLNNVEFSDDKSTLNTIPFRETEKYQKKVKKYYIFFNFLYKNT